MNKISIALFSIVAMAGVASAQQAKGSAATPAPAGGAAAKQATPATPAAPAAAMEMPKAPTEVKDMVKMAGARNACKGTGLGMDMKTEVKFTGTITRKADLDNWWVHESMTGTMGEGKTKGTMKMEAYMTFDAKLGKWRMVSVMNDGTQMVGTADFKDGKLEAVSDTTGPMGAGMFKDHGDATDKKVGMHMWGEMSMDKGKTWTKVYDMTCK